MSSLFVWWLFSCSPVPKVSVFLMCLCCKFRFEGKYDDSSNSMLHPAVLTDLFLFYMWGSSLSISVLYRYLIIKSNSDPHPHFLLPCACLPNPHFLLPRARLPPPHLYWFVVGWSLSKGLLLCLNIMNIPRWFSNISEHKVSYGVADRKGRTSDRKELEGGGQALGKKKVREGTEKHIWFMHTYSNETILV